MAGCGLVSGVYADVSALVLLIAAAGTLWYKYESEQGSSGRSRDQYALDASKIIAGVVWAHILESFCAAMFGHIRPSSTSCDFYLLDITLDATLGMWMAYCCFRGIVWLFEFFLGDVKARQITAGRYFDKARQFIKIAYVQQLMVWLLIVTCVKISIAGVVLAEADHLSWVVWTIFGLVLDVPLFNLVVLLAVRTIMVCVISWLSDDIFIRMKAFPGDPETDLEAPLLDDDDQQVPLVEEDTLEPENGEEASGPGDGTFGGEAQPLPEQAASRAGTAQNLEVLHEQGKEHISADRDGEQPELDQRSQQPSQSFDAQRLQPKELDEALAKVPAAEATASPAGTGTAPDPVIARSGTGQSGSLPRGATGQSDGLQQAPSTQQEIVSRGATAEGGLQQAPAPAAPVEEVTAVAKAKAKSRTGFRCGMPVCGRKTTEAP